MCSKFTCDINNVFTLMKKNHNIMGECISVDVQCNKSQKRNFLSLINLVTVLLFFMLWH